MGGLILSEEWMGQSGEKMGLGGSRTMGVRRIWDWYVNLKQNFKGREKKNQISSLNLSLRDSSLCLKIQKGYLFLEQLCPGGKQEPFFMKY